MMVIKTPKIEPKHVSVVPRNLITQWSDLQKFGLKLLRKDVIQFRVTYIFHFHFIVLYFEL